jgi:hypothetical protein
LEKENDIYNKRLEESLIKITEELKAIKLKIFEELSENQDKKLQDLLERLST